MSSWLSLFNSDDDPAVDSSSTTVPGGVKEDLSTFSHRLRGVTSFLAPPPPTPTPTPTPSSNEEVNSQTTSSSSPTIRGIKQDLVEIQQTVKTQFSLLSNKFTSGFFTFNSQREYDYVTVTHDGGNRDDDAEDNSDDDDVVGIREEIVEFVTELSNRGEFWIDFPIRLPEDFNISDSQREHSEAIEHMVPSLESLKQKICNYMSEGHFWMIYFTILLPRFNESDLEYLSTPEIVELRETLVSKLQNDKNTVVDSRENCEVDIVIEEDVQDGKEGEELLHEQISSADPPGLPREADAVNNDKPEQWVDGEGGSPSLQTQWLANDGELSFSDLEDDDKSLSDGQTQFRPGQQDAVSALGERLDWIQLDERSATHSSDYQKAGQSILPGKDSEGEDSNGWDHVDDADIESLMSA